MLSSNKIPNTYCLCAGRCEGNYALTSFDGALLNAGVGNLNLVKMSSILPANCQRVDSFNIQPGSLVPVAYAALTSNREGQKISAAVSVSIPADSSLVGVIMEHSDYASLDVVEARVKAMGKEAMEMRGIIEYTIVSHGTEVIVDKKYTTTFASVVLWFK